MTALQGHTAFLQSFIYDSLVNFPSHLPDQTRPVIHKHVTMAPTATKKRSSHTMAVKHAAIYEADKGAKKANVATRYGISRGLLGDWIQNRVDIQSS